MIKLILIDEQIHITNVNGALNAPEGFIELDLRHIKDSHLYKFEVKFNKEEYVKVEDNKIAIPDFKDSKDYVIIKIRMTNLATSEVRTFESEQIKLSRYYYLGNTIEDTYPQIIGTLVIRVERLEKKVKDLSEKGDIL